MQEIRHIAQQRIPTTLLIFAVEYDGFKRSAARGFVERGVTSVAKCLDR